MVGVSEVLENRLKNIRNRKRNGRKGHTLFMFSHAMAAVR